MSLINDALRRASESDKDRPRANLPPTGMEPAPRTKRSPLAFALGAMVVVIALLLAAWFFRQWWNARSEPVKPIAKPVMPVAIPIPEVIAVPSVPVQIPSPTPAVPKQNPVVALPAPAKPPELVWPAKLKLEGIFFSLTNPHALIDGQTVGVGDEVKGVRVTAIEENQVAVEWTGHKKILRMDAY